MKQDDLEPRPYNPDEDIDYDKEKVITTPHGARVVVPLEGIIKWQKRHYEREIGELKSFVAELEDTNKSLIQQRNNYENQVEVLKKKIKELKADIRENPLFIERVETLQKRNANLQIENGRLKKANAELVAKLINHGIDASVYTEPI